MRGQNNQRSSYSHNWGRGFLVAIFLSCLGNFWIPSLRAQSIQSGVGGAQGAGVPQTTMVPLSPPPTFGSPSFGSPGAVGSVSVTPGVTPPPTFTPPAPSSVPEGFDPYATTIGTPAPLSVPPAGTMNAAPPGGFFGNLFSSPVSSPGISGPVPFSSMSSPGYGTPYDNPNVYGAPPPPSLSGDVYANPTGGYTSPFPATAYPSSTPNTLFPEGVFTGAPTYGFADPNSQFSAYRILQGLRFRHAYIASGDDNDALNINDTDVSLLFAFGNFFYSNQPLYVAPSFSLHLWDGPGPVPSGADLPPNAYSGFLDLGWNSDPNQMFSTEFGIRVGAFTDFDTFNNDSIRIMGKGLGSFRLSPASTLKAGVYYLDRNKIKLLPAFGLLYQPNPYTRWDIFFPQPKFARYCRTVGTRDVWWYLAGDYGGGSWTVQRTNGSSDEIDINDFRVMFGFESGDSQSIRVGRRTAFFEIGYVFNREVLYRRNGQNDFNPDDGIMFRAGFGY